MRILWLGCAAALASLSLAENGLDQPFQAIKGVREFSGRLIAHPKQDVAAVRTNRGVQYLQANRQAAIQMIAPYTVAHSAETDDFLVRVPRGMNESSAADALLRTGNFEYVEPDWIVYPASTPNDPLFNNQWHLNKVHAPLAWDYFQGNGSVTVAVCDTGVRSSHEDLAPLMVPGFNSASNLPQWLGGDVSDINGHGTKSAGIAVAAGNNGMGVSGLSWNLKLMPVRVTNNSNGSTTTYAICQGVKWAADNGARIISVSYSGVASAAVGAAGNYARQRNALLFWSAGNENADLYGFDHLTVTVVGSLDSNDQKEASSNFGRGVDLFAPGVGLWTTTKTGDSTYGSFSGTSAAAPCAAGVAALVMASNPWLSAGQVEQILLESCEHMSLGPDDTYWGWGRVDAAAALGASYDQYGFAPVASSLSAVRTTSSLGDLQASDDVWFGFRAIMGANTDRIQPSLTVTGTSTIASMGRLTFQWEGWSTGQMMAQVKLWDYWANAWTTVDMRQLGGFDQEFSVSPADPNRFMQPGTGQMKARLTFGSMLPNQNCWVYVDSVSWKTGITN